MAVENNGSQANTVPTGAQTTPAPAAPAASASPNTPAPTPAQGDAGAGAPAAGDPPGTQAAAPYTPNFKFKFMGPDGQKAEKEFDDLFKPIVKSSDVEKVIRDLHERAHGLDFVKADRQTVKGQLDALQAQHQEQTASLEFMGSLLQQGDFDTFFNIAKVPPQAVVQWVLGHIERQKDPQKAAEYQSTLDARHRLYAAELQAKQFQTLGSQATMQARSLELDTILSRQDVASVASAFDARMGREGAFRDEVIRRGVLYAQGPNPKDITVAQAVGEVLAIIGTQAAAQPGAAPAGATQTPGTAPASKPVLPPLPGSGGVSPAKKILKSTDDLRKRGQELAAQGL